MSKKSCTFALAKVLNTKNDREEYVPMKKLFLLFTAAICLMACEKGGDVIQGTWKNVVHVSTAASEMDFTYVFDGKGNFTFIDADYDRTSKGTYVIENNNTLVRLHGATKNEAGEEKEYETVLTLDLNSNPPTLSAPMYTSDGTYLGLIIFEKQ